ncbi:MAG: hypothetical protein ACOCVU_07710 [Desulfohalobiaceae bacterium]
MVALLMVIAGALFFCSGAMADEVGDDFQPKAFEQTVERHLEMMQQAIEECDKELYDTTRRDLLRSFQMHKEDLDSRISGIRERHSIPSKVDTPQEANELLESEKAMAAGKGKDVGAAPGKLEDMERLAELLRQKRQLSDIEAKTVFPPYPEPCGEREEAPSAAAPEEAEPDVTADRPAPEVPATAADPGVSEAAAEPSPGAVALGAELGVVQMDVPSSGFGTATAGGTSAFAGKSSDDLNGYTFGLSLMSYLKDDGTLTSEPPVTASPSIGVSFGYVYADDSGRDAVLPGGPDTSIMLQEDFGGLSALTFGPAGMNIHHDEEYKRYSLEVLYRHPCFQAENRLGTFTFFGSGGLGYHQSDYDLKVRAEVPGMAATSSSWRQEVETERTYAILGVELVQQLTEKTALSLGGSIKPGYTDVDFDSDQHVRSTMAAPLDDFSLDADGSDHYWNYEIGADLRILLGFTERFFGSVGVGYKYLDRFSYPDNRMTPADAGPNLDTDDMEMWTGSIGASYIF